MTGSLQAFRMISSLIPESGINHAALVRFRQAPPAPLCNFWVRRQARTACRSRDRPCPVNDAERVVPAGSKDVNLRTNTGSAANMAVDALHDIWGLTVHALPC